MFRTSTSFYRGLNLILEFCCCLLLTTIVFDCRSLQQEIPLKTEPLTIDLYHKFYTNQEFKLRGSILVKPKTEYRVAQASILQQAQLSASDLEALKGASDLDEAYYLKASLRKSKEDKQIVKEAQTLIKACSLYNSNLADFITINLSPFNDFLSVNLFTSDPECNNPVIQGLQSDFNTTILVESGAVGPSPDTATYIKRLEEERQSKQKDGKVDDRSFFAKYWIYIVPAVIILMIFSGPEQGAR